MEKTIKQHLEALKSLDKKETFDYLFKNQKELIHAKKSVVKTGCNIGYAPASKGGKEATKGVITKSNELEVSFIGNVANWLDSHGDVQGAGCWKKTLKENKGSIQHRKNHGNDIESIIGDMQEVYTIDLPIKELGLKGSRKTEVLIGRSTMDYDINPKECKMYVKGRINQHSVGMRYVKLTLCMNSEDEDHKKEKSNYDKYISLVLNPELAEKNGFFWYVNESILKEISAVSEGSNSLTPTYSIEQKIEPSDDTQTEVKQIDEPLQSTQTEVKQIDEPLQSTQANINLINNFKI